MITRKTYAFDNNGKDFPAMAVEVEEGEVFTAANRPHGQHQFVNATILLDDRGPACTSRRTRATVGFAAGVPMTELLAREFGTAAGWREVTAETPYWSGSAYCGPSGVEVAATANA